MSTDRLPPVPTGLQALIQACSLDAVLLERIVAGRSAAALEAGFALTKSEAATLDATSADQIRQMVEAWRPVGAPLEGPGAPTRPDDREPTTGILADEPPPRPQVVARTAGIRPDQIPRPGRSEVTRGIRPGVPVAGGFRIPLWLIFLAAGIGFAAYYFFFRGR